jgi:hypothetical protein
LDAQIKLQQHLYTAGFAGDTTLATQEFYMENIFLFALLMFIGWHVLAIRKDISNRNLSTTLFLSIESNEKDKDDIPLECIKLLKKTNISFAIVPSMELVEPGEHKSLVVSRVVFEAYQDNIRGVYLHPRRIELLELEAQKNWYLKHGWQNDG